MPIAETFDNVRSWAPDLEENVRQQARDTGSVEIMAGPVALMPDAHLGIGATVGSVLATKGAIIPAAVGVDIGCGMIAVETNLTSLDLPDDLGELHSAFVAAVPAGMGKGHDARRADEEVAGRHWMGAPDHLTDDQAVTAFRQFGSLGGGNHFLELCLDETDQVWVVLHSGSRGIGNQLARVHIEKARGVMAEAVAEGLRQPVPDRDLAYLLDTDPEFGAYIADLLWAQRYALGSREVMMDLALAEVARVLGVDLSTLERDRINCHHNFTQQERHNGTDVWLTRKGAIQAGIGDRGIIPGSMGAATYIVDGLGNPESYHSCSHGAGRVLGRKAAQRTLDLETFVASMEGKAWDSTKAEQLLDEDPRAYRNIDQVMAAQADLVRPVHVLRQVLNMKGTN